MNANAAAVATDIARAKPSARRNARVLKTSSVHIQFEADGADIDNEAPRARGVELAPQIADLDIDDIGLRHEFEIPDVLEQHPPGDDLVRPAHEIFKKSELSWQQIYKLAVATDGSLDEIHFQETDLQSRESRVMSTAQEGFDSRGQFADVERLYEIVIAASFQSSDAVVNRRQRADHESRCRVAFGAQRFDD